MKMPFLRSFRKYYRYLKIEELSTVGKRDLIRGLIFRKLSSFTVNEFNRFLPQLKQAGFRLLGEGQHIVGNHRIVHMRNDVAAKSH